MNWVPGILVLMGLNGPRISRGASGFMSNFPKIGGAFAKGFETVRVTLFVWADDIVKWVKGIPGRFQSALATGFETLGRYVGRVW